MGQTHPYNHGPIPVQVLKISFVLGVMRVPVEPVKCLLRQAECNRVPALMIICGQCINAKSIAVSFFIVLFTLPALSVSE